MRTFKDLIESYKKDEEISGELLPFCHTTKYKILLKYIMNNDNLLEAHRECEYHNNEKLIFLFYGKSAYFPSEDQVDKYDEDLPVTLLYKDLDKKEEIKRLCCFDSGAYLSGRFNFENSEAAEPVNTLEDYIIDSPTTEDIIAGVNALYNNNDNYLKNKFAPYFDVNKKHFCVCLVTINDIFKNKGLSITEYGPQAFTFEVQIEDKIKSKPDVVFLPEIKAEDEETIIGWSEQFPESKIMIYRYSDHQNINTAYDHMREQIINYKE